MSYSVFRTPYHDLRQAQKYGGVIPINDISTPHLVITGFQLLYDKTT